MASSLVGACLLSSVPIEADRVFRTSFEANGCSAGVCPGIQTTLNFRDTPLTRKAIIRHQTVVKTAHETVAKLENSGVRTRHWKLQLDPTLRTKVRPNFILLSTALIHLNTLGPPEDANTCAAQRILHFPGVFWARRDEKGVLGKDTHRSQGDQIAQR